jgi:hypothetical protein
MLVFLWTLGLYLRHLVHLWPFGNLIVFWYSFPRFGIYYQEKNLATLRPSSIRPQGILIRTVCLFPESVRGRLECIRDENKSLPSMDHC